MKFIIYNISIFKTWFRYIILKSTIKMEDIEFVEKSYKSTKREKNLINRIKKINSL